MLVNARLSERSLNKYQKFSSNLVQKTINQLTLIGSQNKQSCERFLSLGASPDKVVTVGNLKFDSNEVMDPESYEEMRLIVRKRNIVVFASTRDGEEKQNMMGFRS